MIPRRLSDAIDRTFNENATDSDDSDEQVLYEPGVEHLQELLEGCLAEVEDSGVSADAVSETLVKKVFKDKGWSENKSFSKDDFDTLCQSLCSLEENGQRMEEDVLDDEDPKQDKSMKMAFPLVQPTDLSDKDEQMAAEQSLKLVEKVDAVKLQSYLDLMFKEYFETYPRDDASISIEQIRACWARSGYYKHVRNFTANDCLDNRAFTHRFDGPTFIPLIPAHSFEDEEKKRDALDAIALMKPHLLQALDKELWAEWETMKKVLDLADMDLHDNFREFLEDDYFRILRQTCEKNRSEVTTLLFEPRVDPAFEASPTEANERKALLQKASIQDHLFAVQVVDTEYAKALECSPSAAKKRASPQAPSKFAASRYYAALEERIKSKTGEEARAQQNTDQAGPIGADAELQQKNTKSDSSGTAHVSRAAPKASQTGLDALMSGETVASPKKTEEEKLQYKSTLEILKSPEESIRCNFQGLLVVCDDVPRSVVIGDASPRKRKASNTEAKATDVIFVDKTGAIKASLWGEISEEICSMWRQMNEARERGERKPVFVDLLNVRILALANNTWNGQSITRHRVLNSIDSVNGEGGTMITMLETPTAENLLQMPFAIPPPECCVTVFRGLRNKLVPPFRLTVKGKVVDLQSREVSQAGNSKRIFDLVDNSGLYITCCAMKHNAESRALENYQDVVLYFGSGRPQIGSSKAMLYLMQDAFIVSIGAPTLLHAAKTEQLTIG